MQGDRGVSSILKINNQLFNLLFVLLRALASSWQYISPNPHRYLILVVTVSFFLRNSIFLVQCSVDPILRVPPCRRAYVVLNFRLQTTDSRLLLQLIENDLSIYHSQQTMRGWQLLQGNGEDII